MKVLLAQNMYYLPAHGGANKSNRIMLERLAARGHECHVVAPLAGRLAHIAPDALPEHLAARGGEILERTDRTIVYRLAGVTVHGALRGPDLPRTVTGVVAAEQPDWALVPSDDPGMIMMSGVRRRTDRIVYLVHTLQQLPFGPGSFHPSEAATGLIRRATGIVSVSRAAQDYVRRWADLPSKLIYPDVYGAATVRTPDPARQRYVTIVNPCAYKGIDVFLALADALPQVSFLAVNSWGTTDADRRELVARANIVIRESVDDIEQVYGETRVLLMPSLWDETFGYTCVEAMLRGIPVLAADVGGLREAKLGVGGLLPVAPIRGYARGAGAALPEPDVPVQDTTVWLSWIRRLWEDAGEWIGLSEASRIAAHRFVSTIDADELENYLLELAGDTYRQRPQAPATVTS
jgi:glycosyltransferase involved in cell wall biosynthesis